MGHRRRLYQHHRAQAGRSRDLAAKLETERGQRACQKGTRRSRPFLQSFSKYLSPQVYSSIFTGERSVERSPPTARSSPCSSPISPNSPRSPTTGTRGDHQPAQPLSYRNVEDRAGTWRHCIAMAMLTHAMESSLTPFVSGSPKNARIATSGRASFLDRDRERANAPAPNRAGCSAETVKIRSCAGLRGGAGRTRTCNHAVMGDRPSSEKATGPLRIG